MATAPARVRPTPVQLVGAVVGLLIGLTGAGQGSVLAVAVRLIGYPVACAAIVAWVPIVRERRRGWFLAHEAAMAAIALGWLLVPAWPAVAINGLWAAVAAVWWRRASGARP